MVLDIKLFRDEQGGDSESIRKSQRERFKDERLVDEVIELDKQWRQSRLSIFTHLIKLFLALFRADQLKRQKNLTSKTIGEKMKVVLL
jgi:seryl-tRNA synthetase